MSRPARLDGLASRADKAGSSTEATTINVNCNLPKWLVDEARLLCMDSTGKMPNGSWSRLWTEALSLWLSAQKVHSG